MFYANVSSLVRDYDYAIFKGLDVSTEQGRGKHYEMVAREC